MTGSSQSRAGSAVFILVVAAGLLAHPAAAQDRPAPAVELALGTLLFPDDGVVTERLVGGSGRFYVLPRISVGPELAYIRGENHSHVMLTGNVTIDFLGPVSGRPRAVTPFAVVGGGMFRTRESFPNDRDFTSGEGAFTAGGGARAMLGDYVTAGVEARIGWELHLRLNAFVGVRLRQ
jgi:hypothetical protein